MKTLKQLIKQAPVFLHDWAESKLEGLKQDFSVYTQCERTKILFATYSYQDYSGDAWVLFEMDGILYEVNGSHCSCYGLEGQWEPEVVELKALQHRVTEGNFGKGYSSNEFRDELKIFLGF